MFQIIAVLFAGVGIGYALRNFSWLQKTGKTISYNIFVLLFLLGISIGTNKSVFENLSSLGLHAFLLAVGGTLGSALAALAVYNLVFRKEGRK